MCRECCFWNIADVVSSVLEKAARMKIVLQSGVRVDEGVVGAWLEAIPDREVLTRLVRCTLLVEHGTGYKL